MTTFSNNLEKKDRFETGLKFFLDHLGQAKFFFRKGLTIACMNTVGNVPDSSDSFTTYGK